MSGVPIEEATAADFIMVRAALVRRVGGANEALVWSRIFYRVGPDSFAAYELDGHRWWAATLAQIALETGLTQKQVRTALDKLVAEGLAVRKQPAGYDRTASYRPVVHVPAGADGSARMGSIHVPAGADVPLTDTEDSSSLIEADEVERVISIEDAFSAFWVAWPRKKSVADARKAFGGLFSKVPVKDREAWLSSVIQGVVRAKHEWFVVAGRSMDKVPYPATWLRAEGWTDVPDIEVRPVDQLDDRKVIRGGRVVA